ncbi:MAG: hypothetical protein MUF38_05575, partial [Anaerolineae bacterium]|nr:hypothetical protein [Anaerolineae bacterium]
MSKLLSFVLFWAVVGGLSAQPPPLPDPSDLFLPSLESIHIYPVIDNDNRTLYVYSEGEWQTVPFPDDVTWLNSPLAQPDGSTLMLSETFEDNFRETFVWRLADDGDGYQLRLIETPCDAGERSLDEPWGVFTAEDGSMSLCNVLTGETSPPLPDGAQVAGYPVATSPDGRYIVVNTYADSKDVVYAYDRTDQIFRRLGVRGYLDDLFSDTVWLTPTTFYFESSDM